MSTEPSPSRLEYASPGPAPKGWRTADCVFAWSAIAVILTFPALLTAVLWKATGPERYSAFKILFPYMMLTRFLPQDLAPIMSFAAVLQFAAYGVICGLAESRGRLARTATLLIALHAVAAGLCFILPVESYL
jgi:hypothetical protein